MKDNIPNNFVDLTITSPPYDDLRKYNGYVFDYKTMLNELFRITKIGGVVVWVVGDKTVRGSETLTSLKQVLYAKEIGFNVHDTMIWGKTNPPPQTKEGKRYTASFEYMFVLTKEKIKTFNPIMIDCKMKGTILNTNASQRKIDGTIREDRKEKRKGTKVKSKKQLSNIWEFANTGYKGHPAAFPEQLALNHILSWSNEGDIVMDCMCGSGTVCKMAYLNNRKFIGIDMSEEYINNICKPRLKEYGWKDIYI